MTDKRIISGKNYKLYQIYSDWMDAYKHARQMRGEGKQARATKLKDGTGKVYITKRYWNKK